MSKVKLFSQNPNTLGLTVTLPLVGDQKFDEKDNSITLDKEKAEELIKLNFGITLSTSKESNNEDEEDENKKMLNALTEDELTDLLATYPQKQTKNLKTREEKIDYLYKEMSK